MNSLLDNLLSKSVKEHLPVERLAVLCTASWLFSAAGYVFCAAACRLLWKWTETRERLPSGALVQLQTRGGDAELVLTPTN